MRFRFIQVPLVFLLLLGPGTSLKAVDFYWVGGTGNWADTLHWATTSGGAIHPSQLPSSADNVIFDLLSFTGSDTVFVTSNVIACKDMDWRNVNSSFSPVFTSSTAANTIRIYGSLWIPSHVNYTGRQDIEFLTLGNAQIQTGGNLFYGKILLNSVSGQWTLVDAFSSVQNSIFELRQGSFSTAGQTLSVPLFLSSNANVRSLDISNSLVLINR
ncbi:MAG TPA: hypothetical protein ENJ82_03965, partial [Bacteroidetes bacterium]|nr:hypothetical protein [Bacteroidota bacterium]